MEGRAVVLTGWVGVNWKRLDPLNLLSDRRQTRQIKAGQTGFSRLRTTGSVLDNKATHQNPQHPVEGGRHRVMTCIIPDRRSFVSHGVKIRRAIKTHLARQAKLCSVWWSQTRVAAGGPSGGDGEGPPSEGNKVNKTGARE